MNEPKEIQECIHFIEHKEWRKKHPLGPVTWDGWCSQCGFKIEDEKFDNGSGLGISGNGRRLAECVEIIYVNGERFESNSTKIYCSVCVPNSGIKLNPTCQRCQGSFLC